MANRKDKPGETPEQAEKRRLEQNLRKRMSRAKEKGELPGDDDKSLAERKAMMLTKILWEQHLTKLSPDERVGLNVRINRWNDMTTLLDIGTGALRGEMDEADAGFVLLIAKEAADFEKEFPLSRDPLYKAAQRCGWDETSNGIEPGKSCPVNWEELYNRLKDVGTLGLYGFPIDHIDAMAYLDFCWALQVRKRPERKPLSVCAAEQFYEEAQSAEGEF